MFQTTEAPGCYGGVLQPLKYRTIRRTDSNILSSMDVGNFMTWKGQCMECKTPKWSGVVIFYSNLLRLRKTFPPCHTVWYGEYYLPHLEDPFRVQTSISAGDDEIEDLETEERLNKRFRIARDGDHLKGIPFEYDLCQFRNVNERDPIYGKYKDNYNLLRIVRSILDAFWSRETSTVSVNFRRLRRDYFESAKVLSIRIPVPVIGTNKFRDRVGMGCAIQNLDTSKRKGKWQDQLQWDSMRRTPT